MRVQNGPSPQIRIFFRKPANEPYFFHSRLSTCQKSQSDINLLVKYWRLKKYWNLIGWEPFLPFNWEPDFSKACSFLRMLMNHKNFHFTQIPDKINDFLKKYKKHVFEPFWSFLVGFAWSGWRTQLYMGP